jgi:Protein of unknown function (DUF2637)
MPDNSAPAINRREKAARFIRVAYSRFIWLLVLVPILGVSAYSLFWVARHFGVPPEIAIFMSTCFDGAALVGADYSLKYATAGLSGGTPRTFVRTLALVSAFLQTFHARLDHQPPGAWLMWASLPIIAVVLYDIHIKFERRKALARAGIVYPSSLPQYGLTRWILFPGKTLTDFRSIVAARSAALQTVAIITTREFASQTGKIKNTREVIEPAPEPVELEPAAINPEPQVIEPDVLEEHRRRHASGSWEEQRTPELHIKEWARAQPEFAGQVPDRGRTPKKIKAAYYAAHPDDRTG